MMAASGAPAAVRRLLDDAVGRAYPGAVLAVLLRGEVVMRYATGQTARVPARSPADPPGSAGASPVTPGTIYDLASLTKVVATLPLILQAIAQGALGLDDPLPRYLPESPHTAITIRHLLAHTSGLPAWVPFYLEAHGYDAIVRQAAEIPLSGTPGAQVLYSDLDYILLGEVARRTLGAPLDELAHARIFRPLGMARTRYRPPAEARAQIAPTEDGTAIEQTMAGDAGRRHTWRKTLIWGEVHDSTAYSMGGIAGHAGLFGPADDLIAYARMWLAEGRGPAGPVLPPTLVREATIRQTPGDAARGLGWALAGPHAWWGEALSARAYGHTGFTGTSMAVDPERDLAIVFLSNAVHLGRDRKDILALRPQVAAAVVHALP